MKPGIFWESPSLTKSGFRIRMEVIPSGLIFTSQIQSVANVQIDGSISAEVCFLNRSQLAIYTPFGIDNIFRIARKWAMAQDKELVQHIHDIWDKIRNTPNFIISDQPSYVDCEHHKTKDPKPNLN